MIQLLLQQCPFEFSAIPYKQVKHLYKPIELVQVAQVEGQHVLFVLSLLKPVLHKVQINDALQLLQFIGQQTPAFGTVLSIP